MFKTELHISELEQAVWKDWDSFVLQQRDGTIFHTSIWLGCQPVTSLRIFGVFDGEKLVGGAPLCIREKMGIRIVPQPLLTPYFGPVFCDAFLMSGRLEEALELLLQRVYQKYDAFCFSAAPQASQMRDALAKIPFYDGRHRIVKNMRTNRKKLVSPGDLIDSYPRMSRRNEIRRAMRKGTKARESTDFETIYRLSEMSFESTGRKHPLTPDEFTELANKMDFYGLGKGYITYSSDDIPVASAWLLTDRNTTYNVLAGVDPQYKNYNGGSVALHTAISESMKQNLLFDFGGSMIDGVNEYLKAYGTEECWYTHYRSVESFKMKFLKSVHLVKF